MQVFSTLHLLQLPSSPWQQAVAVSGWSGGLATDPMGHPQQQVDSSIQAAMPGSPTSAAAQLQEQLANQDLLAAAQGAHGQQGQHTRQQCQQVPAECVTWAGRPQFKLTVASTCEVVLSLGQLDKCAQAQVRPLLDFVGSVGLFREQSV